MFGEHVSIQMYKARKQDLEAQLVNNSMKLQLKQKHQSVAVSEIHRKYQSEQAMIRNQIEALPDKSGNEYDYLMSLMQESKDMEDKEVAAKEEMASDAEAAINAQNTSLETQIKAIDADLEGLEEMRKENIEKVFGYFK